MTFDHTPQERKQIEAMAIRETMAALRALEEEVRAKIERLEQQRETLVQAAVLLRVAATKAGYEGVR